MILMSLNLCCHDDYTSTDSINAIDVNILTAYQVYLQENSNVPPVVKHLLIFTMLK